ncbi:MAG: hypothetical protein ACOH2D_14745 [Gelidibacter sp.]
MSVDEFKKECQHQTREIVVQKHLIEGESYFFSEIHKGSSEFDFKKNIASILQVHVRDIVIVGSAKLGFSLKPEFQSPGLYQYKEFDHHFNIDNANEKSDLDIAVVSSSLFDKEMKNLFEHTKFYEEKTVKDWGQRPSLAKHFLKGRLALRYFPFDFKLTQEIQKVQSKYKMELGRKVNIEIYKSWYFFETYHMQNIQSIHLNLIAN